VPESSTIDVTTPTDIDVLFFGKVNPRRMVVLDSVTRAGIRLHVADGVYLADRDALVARAKIVLELLGVSANGDLGIRALNGVSLSVRSGEILGVAGVSGNGQRQLAEVISGSRDRTSGDVLLAGRKLRNGDTEEAIEKGVAHVPEDRMGTGVAPSLSIADNLILKSHRRPPISRLGILRRGVALANARELMKRFAVAAPGPETPTRLLSGGNVQKVVLARELSSEPVVIVAANPTRGLDVGATESVRTLLIEAASRGVGILLISEDLDEILVLADRVAVMYEGGVVGERVVGAATIEELGLMMAGAGSED
jgi:simple sugar transport system ATP-binding protein